MDYINKLLKKIFVSMLCLSLILAINSGVMVKADDDITNELKKEVIPLKTVEPNDDLSDLMPLKEILKDKEIVGMGEATHGTSEFFKMKHRVFKFLVEEMGYRAFAIEANFGEGEIINDYILNGVGDEHSALNSFAFWIWKTDEVKDMLNWMRDYNLKAKDEDKIRFYGFDMQSMSDEYYILKKYFHKTKPELEKKLIDKVISNIDLSNSQAKNMIHQNQKEVKELIEDVKNFKNELIEKSSLDEYELMIKNLDIMSQCLQLYEYSVDMKNENDPIVYNYINLRDKYMAENINWIKDREMSLGNNKIMLWAHNEHVFNGKYFNLEPTRMGKHLKSLYGDKYYILGFEFFKGKFKALSNNNLIENELVESNEKTLGYLFNKLETPILYFDSKSILKNPKLEKSFINRETFINSIGAVYNKEQKDNFIVKININETFDGLIFINDTTATKTPVYNFDKKVEPKQKCGTKDDEKISTSPTVLSTGLILLLVLICAGVIKSKNASK